MTAPRPLHPGKLAIAVVLASSPMIALVFTVVAPLLPQMAAYLGPRGNGALMAQMIMTIASMGLVVGAPVTGFLYARWGGWRLMALLLLAFALDGALGAALSSAWAFLASRALLGFLAGGMQMCCYTLIAEMAAGEKRARLIGYQVAAGSGTAVVGLVAAGFIAAAWGWRAPFALYLLAAPLAAAAIFVSSPAANCAAAAAPASEDTGGESALSLWPIYVLVALAAIPLNMPSVQISFELARDGTSSPALISLVVATFSVALMGGSVAYGRIRQRCGGEVIPVFALLLLGAGFLCVGSTHQVRVVILGCLIAGLGAGLLNPHFSVVVLARVSARARSRAVGFLSGAFFAGDLFNPLAVLPLRKLAGIHASFQLVGAALAVTGLAWQMTRRRRRSAPSRA